jgi:hypothetical protein
MSIMLHRIGSVRLEYAALLSCGLSPEAVGISLAYVGEANVIYWASYLEVVS